MKIGFDAKRAFHNRSGLGNYSRDLLRMLSVTPENELHLFTPKVNSQVFEPQFGITHTPKEPIDQWLSAYWRSFSIAKDIRTLKLDIFHGLSNELPFTLGKTCKTVVTIHDLIFKRYPQWYKPFDRTMYDWKFKSACQNADKIIAISQQTKQDIVSFYGIAEHKIEVVYQSCNDSFKTKADEQTLRSVREKYKLPSRYILNVGTIEARKNAFDIVKAIHEHRIDLPLVLVGRSTPYADEIKQYIQHHRLEPQIRILHTVENSELPAFYQMAEMMVYPSTFEGFGIPIIEALYSNLPVITTASGCFPEAGGPNSYYLESRSLDELATAIRTVSQNLDLQHQMKNMGSEYVQRFNTNKIREDLLSVYQNL